MALHRFNRLAACYLRAEPFKSLQSDIIAGFSVFLIALPLCLGIAVASGFPPSAGIITAVTGGLWVGLFAGSPLTVKGPAAGLIAIALGAVEALGQGDTAAGYRSALAVIFVSGILQVLFGVFRAGSLGAFVPPSVVHGMLAAIGIIIISKQIHVLLGVTPVAKAPLQLLAELPRSLTLLNPAVAFIGGVSLLTLLLMSCIKHPLVRKIPPPLAVIFTAVPLGRFFEFNRPHEYVLGDKIYHVSSEYLVKLPDNIFNSITFPDFSQIFSLTACQYVMMFALVGSLESLLTVEAVDRLDPLKRKSDADRDLWAIGTGNIICGLIGGLPMIAEVVRSSANADNGAKTRWANWFHGLFMLLSVVLVPGLIRQIPLSALAAMLIFTGWRLAAPQHFIHARQTGKEQLLIFLTTVLVTLTTDLLAGVAAGILVKIIILRRCGADLRKMFHINIVKEYVGDDKVIVKITGQALFSNYLLFKKQLQETAMVKNIVIDFSNTSLIDHTFMERMSNHKRDCERQGCVIELTGLESHLSFSPHLSAACKKMPIREKEKETVVR